MNIKRPLIAFGILISSFYAIAQNPLEVGQAQINAGVGLSEWGLPVYLGADIGIHKDVTLGLEVSQRTYHENWRKNKYKHQITGVLFNANYHFNTVLNIPTNWDFYAGLNVGYYTWSSPEPYDGVYKSRTGLGAQVGGRYFITDKIGLQLEATEGTAFASGKFGITIKL